MILQILILCVVGYLTIGSCIALWIVVAYPRNQSFRINGRDVAPWKVLVMLAIFWPMGTFSFSDDDEDER